MFRSSASDDFLCFCLGLIFNSLDKKVEKGGGQNLERRNVKRPIFWNFKIANIKITKDELFDNFIFEFNFLFFRQDI